MSRRDKDGFMGLATFTAPGNRAHRRFVTRERYRRGMARPECSCHEHLADGLGRWNATASARWNHLRTVLRRAHPDLVFLRCVEVQERGALHLHVIVWSPTQLTWDELQEAGLRAGFGCSTKWDPCEPGSRRAAAYVSKYVTKAVQRRGTTPWETVDESTGEIVTHDEAPFRSWSSSRDWGLTMKQISEAVARSRRRQAERLRASEPASARGVTVDAAAGEVAGPAPPALD